MIVFDLVCAQEHVFEAWFGSSADYEDQRTRGLVNCPVCGVGDVAKAVMAPNVAPKGNRASNPPPVPMQSGAPAPAEMKALLAAPAKAQSEMLQGSENVGRRFAAEARAMNDGDVPERPIHGQATRDEARALIEDGVPVAPLPLPIPPPDTTH